TAALPADQPPDPGDGGVPGPDRRHRAGADAPAAGTDSRDRGEPRLRWQRPGRGRPVAVLGAGPGGRPGSDPGDPDAGAARPVARADGRAAEGVAHPVPPAAGTGGARHKGTVTEE